MIELANPQDGRRSNPGLFDEGVLQFRLLTAYPFRHWVAVIGGWDDPEDSFPRILYEGTTISNADEVPGSSPRCGFLSAIRWPDFDVKKMAVEDDTPIGDYVYQPDLGNPFQSCAQIEINLLDPGILGPFRSGRFVWHGLRKVFYIPKRNPRLFAVEDEELSKLNQAIRDAMIVEKETQIESSLSSQAAVRMMLREAGISTV